LIYDFFSSLIMACPGSRHLLEHATWGQPSTSTENGFLSLPTDQDL